MFSGVSAEVYRPSIEALLSQRKPVLVRFSGRARSSRCLYARVKLALKYYRDNPEHLPGIQEAYKAIVATKVPEGVRLGLRGWIAGKPINSRSAPFTVLDSPAVH